MRLQFPYMADATEPKGKDWAEFLATAPPDSTSGISNLWKRIGNNFYVQTPDVFLYCDSEACDGSRFFTHETGNINLEAGKWGFGFLHFVCRNCQSKRKA